MTLRNTLSILAVICIAFAAFAPFAAQALEHPVSDLRIHTINGLTGEPATDACYMIENYSVAPECDYDGDGIITFHNMVTGTYSLVQTEDLGTLYPVAESGVSLSALTVIDANTNDYYLTLLDVGTTTDIGIITRDPVTGDVLDGACYELAGYSNIGCDEDGNGIITFTEIPWGTYTIHQTETPAGYKPMGDYEIYLQPFPEAGSAPVNISLVQAEEQGNKTSFNLSVLIVDGESGDRVPGDDKCVQFPGMTNVGCDDDVTDGQIDFVRVDPTIGQPVFEVTALACGYDATGEGDVVMHQYGEYHTALVLTLTQNNDDCS